ncbi:CCL5 protein, partial [Panurus biarmicus]|nr:CCL5 protein [Panurus biarmicus]
SLPVGCDKTSCSFSYTLQQLPQSHVQEYFYTSSKCSQPAVVRSMLTQMVYANLDAKWLKEYVNSLELQ